LAPQDILAAASACGLDTTQLRDADSNLSGALRWAATVADGGPLVIAGSLYLVSDVLRLLRDAEQLKSQFLG
jgi:dihydrofolate synthase